MRLGRHGSLVFTCDEATLCLRGMKDELHRKDLLRLEEASPLEGASRTWTEDAGPSWAPQLLGSYQDLARTLAATGPGFRFAPKGYEHVVSNLHQTPGREIQYIELDRPASACLVAKFQLSAPHAFSLRCAAVRQDKDCFHLGSGTTLWISAPIAPRVESGTITFDLAPGTHELVLVFWSQAVSVVLHPTAFVLSRKESWIAAVVCSWTADRIPLLLPADTLDDARNTHRLIQDIQPARVVVGAGVDPHLAAMATQGFDKPATLPADGTLGAAIGDVLGMEAPRRGVAIGPDSADPASALRRAQRDGNKLVPAQCGVDVEPVVEDVTLACESLVLCDSGDPMVRVLATAYAGVQNAGLLLIAGGAPPAPPDWQAHSEIMWAPLIHDYRQRLTRDVKALVPASLRERHFARVAAFTSGRAYSLVETAEGPWATTTALGLIADADAPWLVPRCLFHSAAAQPPATFTIVCDALSSDHADSDAGAAVEHLSGTVSQPIPLIGADATAASLQHILALAPIDVVSLKCHGYEDLVELADGPLRSQVIQTWKVFSRPLVINNSCASWPTTGPSFVAAGARGYIGTLWPVRHTTATEISASVFERIVAAPGTEVGDIVRHAIAKAADSDEHSALAYVLVGLPELPGRVQPVDSGTSEQDVREYALLASHALCIGLVERGQVHIASRVHDIVTRDVVRHLEQTQRSQPAGFLRIFNRPIESLPSILATMEVDFWRALLDRAGPDSVPGGLDGLLAKVEDAIRLWEAGAAEGSLDAAVIRGTIVSAITLTAVTSLARVGRWDKAWEYACRFGARDLRAAALTGPAPTRADSEFAVLAIEALRADPTESAEHCFLVFERARDAHDPALMWMAVEMILRLERKQFIRDRDPARLRACLELVGEAMREEDVSHPHVAAAFRRLSVFLQQEAAEFGPLLRESDCRWFFEVLNEIDGDPRWRRGIDLIESCAEWDAKMLCAGRPLWKRTATVTISPPNRTRAVIVDTPPPGVAGPLFVRYPMSVPSGGSVRLLRASVEHTDEGQQIGRSLYYRCSGEHPATLVIEKEGQVAPAPSGFIRYAEVWGSPEFLYDLTILLPDGCVPAALRIKNSRDALYPAAALVTRREDRWAVEVGCDPRVLARLEQLPPFPSIPRGWLGFVTLEFFPVPQPISDALARASAPFPMPFRSFFALLDRTLRDAPEET